MKIAFDHQIFCNQKYGGISRYFTKLSKELIKKNSDVKIFAPLHQNIYAKNLSKKVLDGLYIKKFPPKSTRFISQINNLIANKKINNWNPAVIHRTYFDEAIIQNEVPAVITVYDMIHELFPNKFSKKDKTSEKKKLAVKKADHVICISENTKKDLIDILNIEESKISVTHLGSEFEKVNDNLKLKDKDPFLLFVGDRDGYKNFNNFILAISSDIELKEMKIICFGGGKFSKKERNNFKKFGISKNQIKQISGDDNLLRLYYKSAEALIYPSLYEGFGLPPLEAMNYSCPVICSDTSSIPEIVGDAGCFFSPNLIEDIAYSIKKVLFSETLKQELINKGQERCKLFTWEKCAQRTQNIYSKII